MQVMEERLPLLILVSGMPATGKTTFAEWLSSEMRVPLVCYDHIKAKLLESVKEAGPISYELFLFICEEIMKSSSPLIAEYLFSKQMEDTLDGLTAKYQYKTVTVHMDTPVETAYRRFSDRNSAGIRPSDISFEKFAAFTKQNKDFRYGENFIYVDTADFSKLSYADIAEKICKARRI